MNILSIDFDIIMAPDIQLYNDFVPEKDWDELMRFPQMALIRPNFFIYNKITTFLLNVLRNKPKCFLIQDHGMAGNIIASLNEKSNIFNIDHHHDIQYDGPKAEEKLTCANWVKWIYNRNLLENYYWIGDFQSKDCKYDVDFIINKYLIEDFTLDYFNFDVIILCLSEPWIPPQVRELFFLWCNILKEYGYNDKIDFTIP